MYSAHTRRVRALYKQMMRNAKDWADEFDDARQGCLKARVYLDQYRNLSNPYEIEDFLKKEEQKVILNKHPQPFYCTKLIT